MKRASRLVLLMTCLMLGAPMIPATASADPTFYAVYCSNDKNNLSLRGGNHALLDCSGSSPQVETKVKNLSTNPKGAHAVTIVQADCYPDSATSTIKDGRVQCSSGPPATVSLGKHFAADKKAAAAVKKKSGKKSSKKSSEKKKKGGISIDAGQSPISSGNLPTSSADTNTIQTLLRIAFGIIGAFALLSMTASGFKYITSGGDPGKTSEAKKGIVFALVGLMIAVSAEAIVAFVIRRGAP